MLTPNEALSAHSFNTPGVPAFPMLFSPRSHNGGATVQQTTDSMVDDRQWRYPLGEMGCEFDDQYAEQYIFNTSQTIRSGSQPQS